jgi:hypothetical protein
VRKRIYFNQCHNSAETAVVKMLAKDMDAEIVEWQEGQSGKTVDGDPGEHLDDGRLARPGRSGQDEHAAPFRDLGIRRVGFVEPGQSGKTVDDDPGEQDATLGSSQVLCFRYRRTVALIEGARAIRGL